ncbi:MAG: hypothetical protein K2Y37_18535 [Pirellulales bacterium]|nr:hypothetical protein [Pirellulales bacterium]
MHFWIRSWSTDFTASTQEARCRRMKLRRIQTALPTNCQAHGFIYEADSEADLSEDMLDVVLPNGILITAGWFTDENGKNGAYRVEVYRGYHELVRPLRSKTGSEASQDVTTLAQRFVERNLSVSDSTEQVVPQAVVQGQSHSIDKGPGVAVRVVDYDLPVGAKVGGQHG